MKPACSWLRRSIGSAALACLVATAGCADRTPVAAAVSVAVNRDTVTSGSPIDVTLQFVSSRNAGDALKDGRVLLRILFADGEVMATYDHDPDPPTSQWQPGATIRYTKRIFVRTVPYSGGATLVVGLTSKQTGQSLRLIGDELGGRMYKAASLTIRQSPSLVTYDDGWYRAEGSAELANEWHWMGEQATMSLPNPRGDSILYLRVGGSPAASETPQELSIETGGRVIRQIEVKPATTDYEVPVSGADAGSGETVKLALKVDRTFVPAKVSGGNDTRTLGVRVFNAFLEPRESKTTP